MGFKFGQEIIDKIRGNKAVKNYHKKSYSQDGEDVVLVSFYDSNFKEKGFYVDLGALHPLRFSNTQYFYEHGWRGLNVDATPNSMLEFNKLRPDDINVEVGISNSESELFYYLFEEPALNSFDQKLSLERIEKGWILKEKKQVKTLSINKLLEKYLPQGQYIDFITMDLEGLELPILKSLDFNKFAPDYFLIEDLNGKGLDLSTLQSSELHQLMDSHGYVAVAKTLRTIIYKANK